MALLTTVCLNTPPSPSLVPSWKTPLHSSKPRSNNPFPPKLPSLLRSSYPSGFLGHCSYAPNSESTASIEMKLASASVQLLPGFTRPLAGREEATLRWASGSLKWVLCSVARVGGWTDQSRVCSLPWLIPCLLAPRALPTHLCLPHSLLNPLGVFSLLCHLPQSPRRKSGLRYWMGSWSS